MRANLSQVVGLKDLLNTQDSPNSSSTSDCACDQGLNLLFAAKRSITQAEILASIPPRDVVDRLISRYFSVMDMAIGLSSLSLRLNSADPRFLVILHIPSFQKEVTTSLMIES